MNNTVKYPYKFDHIDGFALGEPVAQGKKPVIQQTLLFNMMHIVRGTGRKILAVYIFNPNILLTSNQVSKELSLNQ